ncbi:NAD(P)-dependent oxidoreductase, partial [bacterium]|nr:NAD(P)-dependent oxidoreductase [bacterium]
MNFKHLRGKRVALIGGAGFIGHNLAIALHHRGAIVHVIDGLVVNNLLSFSGMFEDQSLRSLYLHMIHERIELLHEHGIQLHIQDARNYHELSGVMNEI